MRKEPVHDSPRGRAQTGIPPNEDSRPWIPASVRNGAGRDNVMLPISYQTMFHCARPSWTLVDHHSSWYPQNGSPCNMQATFLTVPSFPVSARDPS